MRSLLTRFALLGMVGALAVGASVPASAATRHRTPAPTASSEPYSPYAPYMTESAVAGRALGDNQIGPSWRGPNECFTDDGYGRFTSCDAGGGQ
jgi:hypothetical protein